MFANERPFSPNQASYVARSTLVILPSSILHQWEKELKAWAPLLDVFIFQGSAVHKNTDVALARLMTCDVALISCTA
jgi:SNF2 family DNA or RNA helicase